MSEIKADVDLLVELQKATEKKAPSIADAISKVNSTFFNDDLEEPVIKKADETKPVTPVAQTGEAKVISKRDARLSGESASAGVEFISSMIGEAIIAIKANSKLKGEEKKFYNDVLRDADKKTLTKEGLIIREKGDRIIKDKNRKLQEIKISDSARERMENAFTKYYEVTGKEMSPGLLIACSTIENVLKTIVTAAID